MFDVYIVLGGFLPVLYAVFRYWKRTHVKVNCWFCNLNNIIQRKCQDGWICKHCEQYNGFNPDGGYNRDIPSQWDTSLNGKLSFCSRSYSPNKYPSNGLCHDCNRNQEMKVAQLASFQPINPDNYDQEIENFSYHLERAYRLCTPCVNVLEETLSRKKTHILDMNLQMTGRKTLNGKYLSSKIFARMLVPTSAFMTAAIVIILTLSTLSSLPSDHIFLKPFDFNYKEETSPKRSSSPVPSVSYFVSSHGVCQDGDDIPTPLQPDPLMKFLSGPLDAYLERVASHYLPLCFSGLILQVASSWLSGAGLPLLLWIAFVGNSIGLQFPLFSADLIPIFQTVHVFLTLVILVLSVCEMSCFKANTLSTSKKQKATSSKLRKRNYEDNVRSHSTSGHPVSHRPPSPVPVEPTLSRALPLPELRQNETPVKAPNYLTLPARPASVLSSHTLTSAFALNKSISSPNIDSMIQEDARSDASIDSAFSNGDSITLDGSQDEMVHSLIEGLSIGSLANRRASKKSSEFSTRLYGKDQRRSSLLSPPKLTNIMNESLRSGIWRNTRSNNMPPTAVDTSLNQTLTESFNQSLSRPSSPCGSVHSQAIAQAVPVPRNFSPPLPFQPVVSAWNCPPPQSPISVSLPPNPLATNPGFGNISLPLSRPPISQVIYTPYGLYHQMMSPYGNPMYMMPPQSPPFNSGSPASSYGSQFSPQSFSTSSHKDLNSLYDSDYNVDLSPKSMTGKLRKKSSSFLESMWQSRLAIMYTTLCYLLLGFVLTTLSYSDLVTNVFSKAMDWK